MRPLRRRTRLERLVKAAGDTQLVKGVRSALSDIQRSKRVKSGATAVVATTAASTAISALRRRLDNE